MPVLSTRRFSGPSARRYLIRMASVFCRRHRVVQPGTARSRPAIRRRLATVPVDCRNGSLNRTLIARHNRIAASQNTAGRPGRPSCGASRINALSSQTDNAPRLRTAPPAHRPACAPPRRSRAGSRCGNGRRMACSCARSDRMDPRRGFSSVRGVQQRLSTSWPKTMWPPPSRKAPSISLRSIRLKRTHGEKLRRSGWPFARSKARPGSQPSRHGWIMPAHRSPPSHQPARHSNRSRNTGMA